MRARQATGSGAPSLQQLARAAGFRSVEAVRVHLDGARSRAEVTGVVHRYPRTLPVSLATATRLAAAGAPLQVLGSTAEAAA